jgi:hypothetical protein
VKLFQQHTVLRKQPRVAIKRSRNFTVATQLQLKGPKDSVDQFSRDRCYAHAVLGPNVFLDSLELVGSATQRIIGGSTPTKNRSCRPPRRPGIALRIRRVIASIIAMSGTFIAGARLRRVDKDLPFVQDQAIHRHPHLRPRDNITVMDGRIAEPMAAGATPIPA